MRGDYLFTVDREPRFIVMVDEKGAWSAALYRCENETFNYEVDDGCPWVTNITQVMNVINGSSRSTILTDSNTLYKLLLGTLKARIAFVTGKVTITGDLSAFLKMVSLLKRNGVRPANEKRIRAKF